jgi:hypothetical protein
MSAHVRLGISSPLWGVYDVADEGALSWFWCVVDTLSEAVSSTQIPSSLMFAASRFTCGTLFSDMFTRQEPLCTRESRQGTSDKAR